MGKTGRRLRNLIFIVLIVATNTLGNFFLALAMNHMPNFQTEPFGDYARAILTNGWFLAGVALLALWMISQLSMFTWADLSYVLPMTASTYAFTAILSKFYLGERISIERWAGIAIISFGVLMVAETPPWTHSLPPPEEEP
jgi:drug/metabolite transporter (DMT)-like permease